MKSVILTLSFLFLMTVVACNTNTVDSGDEQSALEQQNTTEIETVLAADPDLNFDAIEDDSESSIDNDNPNWMGSSALGKTTARRIRFGRIRTAPVERNVQIVFDTDTTATAYLYTKLEGKFIVHKVEADSDSVAYHRFEKPMVHEVERVIHLKKFRETDNERRNWKILDVSMKNGSSPDKNVEIVKLEVMASGLDTTVITEPLDYFMNGVNMFIFPRWTEIRLRATVRNSNTNLVVFPEGTKSTEMVRLHYGRNRMGHVARSPFTWVGQDDQGNNIYEGNWTVQQFKGIHHAVVDVIDNGTILEPDAEMYPYSSNTWATPYRVTIF